MNDFNDVRLNNEENYYTNAEDNESNKSGAGRIKRELTEEDHEMRETVQGIFLRTQELLRLAHADGKLDQKKVNIFHLYSNTLYYTFHLITW